MSAWLCVVAQPWRNHLQLLGNERSQPYLITAFTLWLVGAVEIVQKTSGQRLDPRFWMAVAILITIYTGARIFQLTAAKSNVGRMKGSTPAAELVNRIRSSRIAVYPNRNDNADSYVVVGPAGVYAMQVKARKVFGSRTVDFRKENELVLGGRIADSRPLRQAQGAADKIRERLQGVLPTRPVVKPLVVFLNDWQIERGQSPTEVTVVNENELQQYFSDQETVLDSSELETIAHHLN